MKQLIISSILFCFPVAVFASGIQVSPSKLSVEVGEKSAISTFVVVNPSADVQLFEVYPDDFNESIIVTPKSFTLESGSQKQVTLVVHPGKIFAQNSVLSTSISVVGKPLIQANVSVGAGVKIPLTISAGSSGENNLLSKEQLVGLGVLVVVLSAVYWRIKKKRNYKESQDLVK